MDQLSTAAKLAHTIRKIDEAWQSDIDELARWRKAYERLAKTAGAQAERLKLADALAEAVANYHGSEIEALDMDDALNAYRKSGQRTLFNSPPDLDGLEIVTT